MEDYVSFEQAKNLRELGFDWECNHFYDTSNERPNLRGGYYDFNHDGAYDDTSAPTLNQAQKWLREKHNLYIHIYLHLDDCWRFEIQDVNDIDRFIYEPAQGSWWRTYEQALSDGLDWALELLK